MSSEKQASLWGSPKMKMSERSTFTFGTLGPQTKQFSLLLLRNYILKIISQNMAGSSFPESNIKWTPHFHPHSRTACDQMFLCTQMCVCILDSPWSFLLSLPPSWSSKKQNVSRSTCLRPSVMSTMSPRSRSFLPASDSDKGPARRCVSVIMDRLLGDLPIYYRALTWVYYTTQRFCLTPISA